MAKIRLAQPQDAAALLDISKQYIDTPNTLEYELPSDSAFADWLEGALTKFPVLVVETENGISAYGYASQKAGSPAQAWNASLQAFVGLNVRGQGYGFHLMVALMELLKLQGVYNVYSQITEGNPRSEVLHRKLGFNVSGTLHKTGFKNGRWLDVHVVEKRLQEDQSGKEPAPVQPFTAVASALVEAVLADANKKLEARSDL